jgi:hypothetical protein
VSSVREEGEPCTTSREVACKILWWFMNVRITKTGSKAGRENYPLIIQPNLQGPFRPKLRLSLYIQVKVKLDSHPPSCSPSWT